MPTIFVFMGRQLANVVLSMLLDFSKKEKFILKLYFMCDSLSSQCVSFKKILRYGPNNQKGLLRGDCIHPRMCGCLLIEVSCASKFGTSVDFIMV